MTRKFLTLFAIVSALLLTTAAIAQPKGSLFIIGGGDRTHELMKQMIEVAQLSKSDYIAILPMSSEEPDSSYFYIKEDLQPVCSNTIAYLNFTAATVTNKKMLDSVEHARLIFITGGDQVRFMKVVLHTPVYSAIHKAFENGSTIAGTSAGAAVMSRQMITGNQLMDTSYHATFSRMRRNNIEFAEGLGLIDSAIVDQHFVVRSRYNRLLSAIDQFPTYTCIGIDEATAIIVHGRNIKVAGESQVLVFSKPEMPEHPNGIIKFKNLRFAIYTAGDQFTY